VQWRRFGARELSTSARKRRRRQFMPRRLFSFESLLRGKLGATPNPMRNVDINGREGDGPRIPFYP
jgi:hypothetical protein